MDNFQIETAQNVSISQNVAGVGDRILAYLIDGLIMFIYILIVFYLFSVLNTSDSDVALILIFTLTLPVFLYHLLWEMLWNGQSPGKAAMNIRVVKLDGTKPAFSNYLLRWLLRVVDITITSGSLAIVTILLNGKGQRIGDLAASTTVISEKPTMGISKLVFTQVPIEYQPFYPQVTLFSDQEMQTIKNIYHENKLRGKHRVILRLSERVAKVMEVQPQEKPIDFLERVIHDYNYYTQHL